jgi:hypothetical protein
MITIYGASDDLVEVDGCEGADEFNVYGEDGKVHWHGDFTGPGATEQLRVHAIYDGCWHFSVGQVDEDVKLPPWPLVIRQGTKSEECDYSAVLLIDAPEQTRLTNIWPAPEAG